MKLIEVLVDTYGFPHTWSVVSKLGQKKEAEIKRELEAHERQGDLNMFLKSKFESCFTGAHDGKGQFNWLIFLGLFFQYMQRRRDVVSRCFQVKATEFNDLLVERLPTLGLEVKFFEELCCCGGQYFFQKMKHHHIMEEHDLVTIKKLPDQALAWLFSLSAFFHIPDE
ncbi:hypothetical protein Ciccas_001868 [Cichlidogyrus casuarinus]|uniref:Uncharacterized protein n=1 Tax=Cichlidogyrus casuarinus TaxID=1844966 RepID=A0ABD2QIT8_9PLAT